MASKLAGALGEPGQFNTLVVDSQVDQIINIARLGVLNLHVKYDIFVFRDVRQLVAVSAIVLLVAAGIGYTIWQLGQPVRMTGDFNVAVASFRQEPPGGTLIAPALSERLFNYLENEYQLSNLSDVQITHKNIGQIAGVDEAETIAAKTNAQLVIYGSVIVVGDSAELAPKFYVADSFRADVGEINGEHQLALPLQFAASQVLTPDGVSTALKQRAGALTNFTKGLAYLQIGAYDDALPSFEQALQQAETVGDFSGKEIFYLFASDAARRVQKPDLARYYVDGALLLNTAYARAYIARANIAYGQGELDSAQADYEKALTLVGAPDDAFIFEKANLGIGNVYHNRFLGATETERPELATMAIKYFQQVIDAVNKLDPPHQPNRERAARAHYDIGRIYQTQQDAQRARTAYRETLKLTNDSDLRNDIEERLQTLEAQ